MFRAQLWMEKVAKRSTGTAMAVVVAGICSGCLYSPYNESVWPTKDTAIPFAGIAEPGPVRIYASTEASTDPSDFEQIGQLESDDRAFFDGEVVIPAHVWSPMCDNEGGWETFVYATHNLTNQSGESRDHPLPFSFDDASVTGRDPGECVSEYSARARWLEGIHECTSEQKPIVRLFTTEEGGVIGPDRIEGDVVITDPGQVAALACVETIEGSLVIDRRRDSPARTG